MLNSAAIGAAHAVTRYSGLVRRVAIVDIDVHHGNGTERVARRLPFVSYTSVFLSHTAPGPKGPDDDEATAFFPHPATGRVPDSGERIVNLPVRPAANAAEAARGQRPAWPTELELRLHNHLCDTPDHPLSAAARLVASGQAVAAGGPEAWRAAFISVVLTGLYRFRPDLIIISAGFDALHGDDLGTDMGLGTHDIFWATRHLVEVAERLCDGRLVSVLEGGYDVKGGRLATATAVHVAALAGQDMPPDLDDRK